MLRRTFLQTASAPFLRAAQRPKPNILLILADDLGWADLGCYGSTFYESPNLDGFARSGVRFTQAYSAGAVCSPTRSSIQTGCYPARAGITDYLPGLRSDGRKLRTPDDFDQMPLAEDTIAEILGEAGYQCFYGGKWHLGPKGYEPPQQGYHFYTPEINGPKNIENAGRYTQGFLDFLAKRDASKPFFAMLSYNEVHTPIIARERWLEHFTAKAKALRPHDPQFLKERNGLTRLRQDDPAYATMLAQLDHQTGEALGAVNKAGLDDRTIVLFTSDNGGLSTLAKMGPTCNLPLRAGKGWLYEGGIRVPLMMRVPGMTPAGARCDVPAISNDFYPTLLELAGVRRPGGKVFDGQSLTPLLRRPESAGRRTLYWHYPHYHGSTWAPGGAMRDGDWKLIEFFEEEKAELYDLSKDLGEREDLSAQRPEILKRMRTQLASWRTEVGAKMPVPR